MYSISKRDVVYRAYEPIVKLIVDIAMVVCAAFLIITLFFGQVMVTGDSMKDTLKDGSICLVDKAVYKISEPKRFDVIAFTPNVGNVADTYIKRIIALPGESVQIKDGFVYIDGEKLESDVIKKPIYNAGITENAMVLRENEYFVLGDNRNNSDDSRFLNVGAVDKDSIIGKVWFTISPMSSFGSIKTQEISQETTQETTKETTKETETTK